jgi:hypothetical protein
MNWFETPIDSPIVIAVTIVYFIASAVETLDIRILQAQRDGIDIESFPKWIGLVYWLCWILFIILVLLNWKFAIIVYVIRFILKVLPVLEIIGNVLMSPFKSNKK